MSDATYGGKDAAAGDAPAVDDFDARMARMRIKAREFAEANPESPKPITYVAPSNPVAGGCSRPAELWSFGVGHYVCIWCDAKREHSLPKGRYSSSKPLAWISKERSVESPTCADVMAMLP